MWLRRCVVLCLGCTVGLLLYLAWRVREGGATASLLCGAAVACKLGCTEITNFTEPADSRTLRSWRNLVFSILRPLVARCTSGAGRSTSGRTGAGDRTGVIGIAKRENYPARRARIK